MQVHSDNFGVDTKTNNIIKTYSLIRLSNLENSLISKDVVNYEVDVSRTSKSKTEKKALFGTSFFKAPKFFVLGPTVCHT